MGYADETLPTRGLTHLVEHLALGDYARAESVAGQVEILFTTFMVEGEPAEVAGRLSEIAGSLAALPMHRLDVERRVMAVESAGKLPPRRAVLMSRWYGARGPGLRAFPELGLRGATAEAVQAHADRWFTAENAVLVLSRPVDLQPLALPRGERRPPPPDEPLALALTPAEVTSPGSGCGVGGPLPIGPSTRVLSALLERRAWAVLRQEWGLAYEVEALATPVSATAAFASVVCDADEEDAPQAAWLAIQIVERIAGGDIDEEELDRARADVVRTFARASVGPLWRPATIDLAGRGWQSPEELADATRRVTAHEVRQLAELLRDRMLVLVPEGTASGAVPPLPTADKPVDGTPHRRRRRPVNDDAVDVVVGSHGVTALAGDAPVTIAYADCVAAVRDGTDALELCDAAGRSIYLEANDVDDGHVALARVEAALSADVIVPDEGSSHEEDAELRQRRRTQLELHDRVRQLDADGRGDEARALVAHALDAHPSDLLLHDLRESLERPRPRRPKRRRPRRR